MLTDLKYALRQLKKTPGFTLFIVLTLALGIGANTAIFSVINSVFLRTLPVKNPQQLVFLSNPDWIGSTTGTKQGNRNNFTYAEFQYLRDHNNVFSGIAAASTQQTSAPNVALEGSEGAGRPAIISLVSGTYFGVLGTNAILGRTFGPEVDQVRNANPVAVVSYAYWKNQLGGDPAILGRRVRVLSSLYSIVGVAPQGFFGETVGHAPDLWIPLAMQAEVLPGKDWLTAETNPLDKREWLQIIGRLEPGSSFNQAKAGIDLSFQQYLKAQTGAVPQDRQRNFLDQHIAPSKGAHGASTLRQGYGEPLVILMGLVALLLLIACANVANLLLARAASRRKEIAIRVAVGARPSRIFCQLLAESLLLSFIGGAVGLLFADWGESLLVQMVSLRGVLDVQLNGVVLVFTLGISILVGMVFGTAPALQAARLDLNAAIKGGGGAADQAARFSLDRILVVAQVAVSLLLLIVAGLFVHSFKKLSSADLGYEHDHLVLMNVDPGAAGYKGAAAGQLLQQLSDRLEAVPGVRRAAFSVLGLLAGGEIGFRIKIEGYKPTAAQRDSMGAFFDEVSPNYFSTVGIPVLLGRDIGPQDSGGGQRVGLINRTMARRYFGDASPIGRRISVSFFASNTAGVSASDFIIVGVAGDAKYHNVREETPPRCYVPFYNPILPLTGVTFEIRSVGDPAALFSSLRAVVKETAPNLPPVDIRTVNQAAAGRLGIDLLLTKLSGFFGILAVALATIGIYGILSYAVARRIREIGIRMALGAQRGRILWLILKDSLILVLAGVMIGIPATLAAKTLISSLLFGLTPADPPVVAAAVVLMFVVAAIAGYFPARRATRVDPLVALRAE